MAREQNRETRKTAVSVDISVLPFPRARRSEPIAIFEIANDKRKIATPVRQHHTFVDTDEESGRDKIRKVRSAKRREEKGNCSTGGNGRRKSINRGRSAARTLRSRRLILRHRVGKDVTSRNVNVIEKERNSLHRTTSSPFPSLLAIRDRDVPCDRYHA